MTAKPLSIELSGQIPDLLQLVAARPDRYPGLLCSLGDDNGNGIDVLFAAPTGGIALRQGHQQRVSGWGTGAAYAVGETFLPALDAWWADEATPLSEQSGFEGGWCVYLAYELAGEIEPSVPFNYDSRQPVAVALRCPAAFIVEHGEQPTARLVVEQNHQYLLPTLKRDYARAQSRALALGRGVPTDLYGSDPERFMHCVTSALEAIRAGDIYQANLSRQWRGSYTRDAAVELFHSLREKNPAPFSALLRLAELDVLSSSPERLVRVMGRAVSTRPIAGTRPRGQTYEADQALVAELIDNPKERAEHVMLIDLERNDLGRICTPGSVEVDEYMSVESYQHVHHIVSNVSGTLLPGSTPGDVIRALFPGGTITGCPKVRCMQIIAELERRARGPYTGSLGYLNRSGNLDLNILIRTVSLIDNEVRLSAGAGIVSDSNPQNELTETDAKAQGMLQALDWSA
ncbi:MAG: aminodeoxychorismate synthase component I [Pseudomonadota bacterium]